MPETTGRTDGRRDLWRGKRREAERGDLMNPERARQLLGGLAAGILTPEERQTLFEAALHDQSLFNEVADELEFAAFLQSPQTCAQLANRIEVAPEPRRWWAPGPGWLAVSGVLAASTLIFLVIWPRHSATVSDLTTMSSSRPSPREAG